jgi:CRISPR system Cascade subunit CasA
VLLTTHPEVTMPSIDLITTQLFSTTLGSMTLPGLLAALSTTDDIEYTALQAHQAHLWHAFLVQLATIALTQNGQTDLVTSESEWSTLLLELHDDESTWWLEQSDPNRPAFFQPPAPNGLAAFNKSWSTPDEMGLLATAKNHDVKRTRIRSPRHEHWIYALICVQTGSGFLGSGNYGNYRMNGGYASRPVVGFYQDQRWPLRFREDVRRIAAWVSRDEDSLGSIDGATLLWTEPWPDNKQADVDELHPLCIEVARRIRCVDGEFRGTTSKAERTNGKVLNGNVGDPWIPISPAKKSDQSGSALNLSRQGFTYPIFVDLLSKRLRLPDYMQPQGRGAYVLIAEALAGEQGQTAGFHRRTLRVPARVGWWMQREESTTTDTLDKRCKRFVELATLARRNVLLPALLELYDEDPRQDGAHRKYIAHFTDAVDDAIFDALFDVEEPISDDAALDPWRRILTTLAESVLHAALDSAPKLSSRSWTQRSTVTGKFHGLKNKHLALSEAT